MFSKKFALVLGSFSTFTFDTKIVEKSLRFRQREQIQFSVFVLHLFRFFFLLIAHIVWSEINIALLSR